MKAKAKVAERNVIPFDDKLIVLQGGKLHEHAS
jgi:hypothetical protein